jgi:TPR repeat protein
VPRVQSEPAPPAAPRTISTDELVILFKRSEELVRQGDIAAARLLLTRAAEAGDARAALTLGATYDAEMLRQIGVRGIAGEPAQARAWYTKAAELGSGEAARRLEQLAQTSR